MKTLAALTTALLAALLILTPALASAATGTITVQTNALSYTTGQTITITGTVSPAPSGTPELIVQVTGPSGVVFREPAMITSGSFSVPGFTAAGPNWVSGSYSVLAGGLSGYNNGTYTFTLTATGVSSSGLALEVFASGSSLVTPGQTAAISALVVWNNGSVAKNVEFTGSQLILPSGTSSSAPAPVSAGNGYWWSIPITSSNPDGLYVVELKAAVGSWVAWGQASFTVNSGIASGSAVNALGKQVSDNFSKTWAALTSMQTAITNAISSSQTAITNAITSAQSALSTAVGTATSAAQTAATDASNAQSNVSNVTTYILVVAILVAITLVLELAVLVRKLS